MYRLTLLNGYKIDILFRALSFRFTLIAFYFIGGVNISKYIANKLTDASNKNSSSWSEFRYKSHPGFLHLLLNIYFPSFSILPCPGRLPWVDYVNHFPYILASSWVWPIGSGRRQMDREKKSVQSIDCPTTSALSLFWQSLLSWTKATVLEGRR